MQLEPVSLPLLQSGDDLASIIAEHADLQASDILAISSKVVATVEGAEINLRDLEVTEEAKEWDRKLNRTEPDPAFRQAVLNETVRLNGRVLGDCPHAMLTELKPDGLEEGTLLVPNAGLDRSNIAEGFAIGWPMDPVASAKNLQNTLSVPVLITDSTCRPRRIGVSAIALTVAGFDPLRSHVGEQDLHGRELRMTNEAVADQLATAANMLMGNAAESIPVVIIRDHNIPQTDFCGWVPGIDPEDDLYAGVL